MAQNYIENLSNEIDAFKLLLTKIQNNGEYSKLYEELNVKELIDRFTTECDKLQGKMNIFQKKFIREQRKIYFFGRMSSGKSKLINGILGEDLFLSAVKHTTNCFVHIRKSDNEKYRIRHGGDTFIYDNKKEAIDKVETISTVNEWSNFTENEFVELFIPLGKDNKILKGNVELVDSPGSGIRGEISECICNYATDANIFVYVLSDDITEEDERFFEFQKTVTKPDIFILFNKWDQLDQDRESKGIDKTYKALKGRCQNLIKTFMGKQTKDIDKRIYFVSAKELLDIRINKKDLNGSKEKERYEEFLHFENYISEYIQNYETSEICRTEIDIERNNFKNLVEKLKKRINKIDFDSSVGKLEKDKMQTERFTKEIQKICEKFKSECNEKIKCNVTTMLNTTTFDKKIIQNKIAKHYFGINRSFRALIKELYEKYGSLIRLLGEAQGAEISTEQIQLNDISQNNSMEVDLDPGVATRFLSFIPIISGFITNAYINKMLTKEISIEDLNEIDKTIHSNDDGKLKMVDDNISNIKFYFTSKAAALMDRQNREINLRNRYKNYLHDFFVRMNARV